METGILILAAGNSSRLGQPKQLLDFKGKSLLRHVAEESLKITKSVVVVTGSNSIEISKEIIDLKLIITENRIWNEGMGSSIHIGFNQLLDSFPAIENCIVSVCDQPFIEASVFSELIQMQQDSQKGIVASKYADTLGTPVLFTKKYFTDLSKLSGKEGAKKLLQKFKDDIAGINFEKGAIDIDTQNDYQQLIQ
ncbi:nucleotidyltransferase family protein [Chryseobacterium caseinilyticum]|uniref:Nucleotidyltransferase family protein n=1 Tax=Chryseobacterium caseinilyticum TaxID=2771428 RepID=A0ABR8Z751_9FLAO|nr:nucleotidyltransferase family protein [Chryseobacterium caseinilyticum]MBD8081078.1 nucleotidyltransferase family protein [Chryseobacterium caseinilyticum]